MHLLVLSYSDVDKAAASLTPSTLLALSANVFFAFSSSHEPSPMYVVHQPHRLTIPTETHTMLFMPARLSNVGTATKIVAVPRPDAPPHIYGNGLPACTIVLDEAQGHAKAIVNARGLTALRNASGACMMVRCDRSEH